MAESDVSYESDLIREVRESKGLTLKEVGMVSGYSTSAISAYELGHLPVPFAYAAGLFRATGDARLLQFLWPGIKQVVMVDEQPVPPPGDATRSNAHLLEAIERLAAAAKTNAKILANGLVDSDDGQNIAAEIHLLNLVTTACQQHTRNLMAWYEQATKGSRR